MRSSRSSTDNIRVSCRFRPLSDKERGTPLCVGFEGTDRVICRQTQNQQGPGSSSADEVNLSSSGIGLVEHYQYSFSRVYDPNTEQKRIYDEVAHPIVDDVMHGYNGTVFVYGQTGSGKTHTMFGAYGTNSAAEAPVFDLKSDTFAGIVPRAVREVFEYIHNADESVEFEIRVLFIEVYMERVRDLLHPAGTNLQVREDTSTGSFYVEDCEMPYVTSAEEILRLVTAGLRRRATSATASNEASSRSHCVLNITVKSIRRTKREATVGKLFLVDLAGSEKVSRTQAAGVRLEEAKLINRSLTSLGHVISCLAEKQTHVPYRDSKLTRILKDSLGGNSRTALIVCCSPSGMSEHETISSLRFGARAQNVCNRAIVNRQFTAEELKSMLDLAKQEIQSLRVQLRERCRSAGPVSARLAAEEGREREAVETLLSCGAREQLDLADLHAEADGLREALRDAQEEVELLRSQSGAQNAVVQLLREETRTWEEEYTRVSRELFAHRRLAEHARTLQQESREEATLSARRMEVYVEQLRAAQAMLEEQQQQQQQQQQHRRTAANSDAHNDSGNTNEHDKKSNGNISIANKIIHGFNNHSIGGAQKDEVNTQHMDASTPFPPTGALSVSSPLVDKNSPLPSFSEEGVPSPMAAQPLAPISPLTDACRSLQGDDEVGESEDLQHTMMMERLSSAMDELELLRNANGALTLELQLAGKKLAIRHERIETLRFGLRQECAANQELQQTLEKERGVSRTQLREARNDAIYWRQRYEDLLRTCHVTRKRGVDRLERETGKRDNTPALEALLMNTSRSTGSNGPRDGARMHNMECGASLTDETLLTAGHGIIVRPIRGGGKREKGNVYE